MATLAVTAYYWPKLPQQAPHHFGVSGRPDAWGHKGLVLILPGISTVLYFILSWQAKRPHRFNYPWLITPENARAQYRWARRMVLSLTAVIMWMFGWLVRETIQTALGESDGLGAAFLPVIVALILGVLGVYLVGAYRAR